MTDSPDRDGPDLGGPDQGGGRLPDRAGGAVSRRAMLLGAAAAALALPRSAAAELACGPFDAQGLQMCQAGLQVQVETARQEQALWCWAACIQAVFAFHGHDVPQSRIVEKVWGAAVDTTATGAQIAYAVNGPWTGARGESFSAAAEILWNTEFGFGQPDAAGQAAQELATGNPLILGTYSHATVLTAMTYVRDSWGRGMALELVVRDPMPGTPNRRVLSQQEALYTQFLTKVHVV